MQIDGEPACNSPLPIFFTDTNISNDDWTTPAVPEPVDAKPTTGAAAVDGQTSGGTQFSAADLSSQVAAALAAARAATGPSLGGQGNHSSGLAPHIQAALLEASPIVQLRNLHPNMTQDTVRYFVISFLGVFHFLP